MSTKQLFVVALIVCGCGNEQSPRPQSEAQTAIPISPAPVSLVHPGGYVSLRPDYRLCLFPFCGGFYIQRVNQPETACGDSSLAPECYVATLELDRLVLTVAETSQLYDGLARVVIRGSIEPRVSATGFQYDALRASAAWLGVGAQAPTGETYVARQHDGQIIAQPLNQTAPVLFGQVDFAGVVAQQDQLGRAREALLDGGLMLTGYPAPGGSDMPTLVVTQFYFPMGPGVVE